MAKIEKDGKMDPNTKVSGCETKTDSLFSTVPNKASAKPQPKLWKHELQAQTWAEGENAGQRLNHKPEGLWTLNSKISTLK